MMCDHPKTLKICLAMGGGVSLGSFSGSCLTESLKLLLLFGKDEDGHPYESVVVDGMSGASAGAIALVILLKSLMDYERMLAVFNEKLKAANPKGFVKLTAASLLDELRATYGATIDTLSPTKKSSLLALEVAQRVQKQIWVNELDIDKLFRDRVKKRYKFKPNQSFALLERAFLMDVAKDYILADGFDSSKSLILDENRVVFACSLTNLLPIATHKQQDAASDISNELAKCIEKNINKSIGTFNHTELRVFDFVFKEQERKPTDRKWFKVAKDHQAKDDYRRDELNVDIHSNKAWSIITSTALACGAFPVAFEPVLLKRYKEEFGEDWPQEFEDIYNTILTNSEIRQKSFFDESGAGRHLRYDAFNFPYVDGGTFNNEPIREAFKIASFQDFGNQDQCFDRIVLFVDPIVRKEENAPFHIASFMPISTGGSGNPKFNNESSKLIANISGLVGGLRSQGTVKEGSKSKEVVENFQLRSSIFQYLDSNKQLEVGLRPHLLSKAFNKIEKNLGKGMISIGTRKTIEYFLDKHERTYIEHEASLENRRSTLAIKQEKVKSYKESLTRITPEALMKLESAMKHNYESFTDMSLVYDILGLKTQQDKYFFAKTVLSIITEFSIGTYGKNPKAKRVGLLPIDTDGNTIDLPGSQVQAFSGFTSVKARAYAEQYGRLSALYTLHTNAFRGEGTSPYLVGLPFEDIKTQYCDHLNAIQYFDYEEIASQIKHLYKLAILRAKRTLFAKADANKKKNYLDLGAKPLRSVGGFIRLLGTFLFARIDDKTASFVSEHALEPITISILSRKKMKTKIYMQSNDGTRRKIIMQRLRKVRIYKGNNVYTEGYQYLFQLYVYVSKDKEMVGLTPYKSISLKGFDSVSKNDPNINPRSFQTFLNDQFGAIKLTKLILESPRKKQNHLEMHDIVEDLAKENSTMYYSIKNLDLHVSPMLEINLEKEGDSWYFKENTKALYKVFSY